MRILVTGSSGFLGRHVFKMLQDEYPDAQLFGASTRNVDLTDLLDTEGLFISTRPTHVFHLAAKVGGIVANLRQPATFFHDNMAMGMNILEAARRFGKRGGVLPRLVMVGTCCSYPKDAELPLRESTIWDGYPEITNAAYGIAKRALLTAASAYHSEYGLDVITLVLANLYGPCDHFDLETSHVIPGMIRRFVEAKESRADHVTLWGDGSPTREFLYVDDAARAIVQVGMQSKDFALYNVGSAVEVNIASLANMVKLIVGFEGQIRWDTSKPNGQPSRVLDCSRLGPWHKVSLEEGLSNTVAWFLANRGAS